MMSRRFGTTAWMFLVAATLSLPALSSSSSGPDLESLFPERADIFVDASGLSRLFLPAEILARCRPDLSDLRIVDPYGREVAYLVDGGLPSETVLEERIVFEPRLLATFRETEERESAPDLLRETYHLSLPAGEPRNWDLVVGSDRDEFVRRLDVSAVQADGRKTSIETGSLFRLQGPVRERVRATLPTLEAEMLAVTLESEEPFFLEPSFRFEISRMLPESEQVRVDLAVRRSRSESGRTIVEVERPRGLVPDELAIRTATGSFNRTFEVWDQGSGSRNSPLGAATLYRLESAPGVEQLTLELGRARGNSLRVLIGDGDSPPLEQLAFQAVLRRPSLVFSANAAAEGEPAAALLFGGARAFRPRYDLEGLFEPTGTEVTGQGARIGVELRDSARLHLARLGPAQPNPRWDPAPALAFAMRPGSKIATWPFEYRSALVVPETREGLLRLSLPAEILAKCRADFADLRIVDTESRQWPYLLDRAGTVQRVALSVRGPETRDRISKYFLDLPSKPLAPAELILDAEAPYFDRPFELMGVPAGNGQPKRSLARGRLVRRPEDPREITLQLAGGRWTELELKIEDGDDSPLRWSSVEARVALPELYFAAPEGGYALLFGSPEARPPRYELEKVRDRVLAVDSTDLAAGELSDNPGRGLFSGSRGEGGWQEWLLWSALALAALVLAGITLRLARQESA